MRHPQVHTALFIPGLSAGTGCLAQSTIALYGIADVGMLPREVQLDTEFSGALVRGSHHQDAGRALPRFLAAPANAAAVESTGLEPVAATH